MLIITADVNGEKIGEILVRRLDVMDRKDSFYDYMVMGPVEYRGMVVKHRYSDGWMVLAKKVLDEIVNKNREANG